MRERFVLASISTLVFASAVAAKPKPVEVAPVATHALLSPKDLTWSEAGPMVPKGARFSLLEGDMRSGPFTFRMQIPAGYKLPPHTHPDVEHITVISGELFMGTGDTIDEKAAKRMPAGSFIVMPKGHAHWLYAKKKTEFQVHGMGPWGFTYVNPADDPRNPPAPATK